MIWLLKQTTYSQSLKAIATVAVSTRWLEKDTKQKKAEIIIRSRKKQVDFKDCKNIGGLTL